MRPDNLYTKTIADFISVPANWADFLPPPPEHPPPIPLSNCNQQIGICYAPSSPGAQRRAIAAAAAQRSGSGLSNHQK